MNYKKIFKTAESRRVVLNGLSFLPDSIMLSLQYKIKTGRRLDLKNPKRFTEKLQWYKLNYRNPIMHQCVDKYLVREFVEAKGLGHTLIPLIGKYSSLRDINFEELPEQFVIKTTHGGGGLNVVICNDKKLLSIEELKSKIDMRPVKEKSLGREWAYGDLQPAIVVEKLLVNAEKPEAGVNDYKILCYNGKAKFIVVDVDRYIGHKRNFYDRDWNNLHVSSDCPKADREIPKPENLNEMLDVAERLSADFPFVRVDLYSVSSKVYFGELTFYPWSGYVQYQPDEADYWFGEDFELVEYR